MIQIEIEKDWCTADSNFIHYPYQHEYTNLFPFRLVSELPTQHTIFISVFIWIFYDAPHVQLQQ